jgi:hypothetical protein
LKKTKKKKLATLSGSLIFNEERTVDRFVTGTFATTVFGVTFSTLSMLERLLTSSSSRILLSASAALDLRTCGVDFLRAGVVIVSL